jgi:hypothetical protein
LSSDDFSRELGRLESEYKMAKTKRRFAERKASEALSHSGKISVRYLKAWGGLQDAIAAESQALARLNLFKRQHRRA